MRDEEDGAGHCSVVPTGRIRALFCQWALKPIKFHLNRKNHAFAVGVAKHWNRLAREVDSWLEVFEDSGDIKNLTGHGAGKNAFGVPASAGCGTR